MAPLGSLAFFPWLEIESSYRCENFYLRKYLRGESPYGANAAKQTIIDKILGRYHQTSEVKIQSATLLELSGRHILDPIPDHLRDTFLEFRETLTFLGLAERDYFDQINYVNNDCFELVIQNFTPPADSIGVQARRKDGTTKTLISSGARPRYKPIHVSKPAGDFKIPTDLLNALLSRLKSTDKKNLYDAIFWFNRANTDRNQIREFTEIVMVVGAFQSLFETNDTNAVIESINDLITNCEEIEPVNIPPERCYRFLFESNIPNSFLSDPYGLWEIWFRDLTRIRHQPAHGSTSLNFEPLWKPKEHLLLGAIFFPLLVKLDLRSDGYTLSDWDVTDLELFNRYCSEYLFQKNWNGQWRLPEIRLSYYNRIQRHRALSSAYQEVYPDE